MSDFTTRNVTISKCCHVVFEILLLLYVTIGIGHLVSCYFILMTQAGFELAYSVNRADALTIELSSQLERAQIQIHIEAHEFFSRIYCYTRYIL